jgi:glycosyltransferase involved in cell wall biosynthesis
MKIVFFGEKSDRPESSIIAGMAQMGHETTWIGPVPHPYHELLSNAGVELLPCEPKSKLDLSSVTKMRSYLKKIRPDAVCAFTGKTIAIMNLALLFSGLSPKRIAYRGAMSGVSALDPTSYLTYRNPHIDAIMCVSEAVRTDLLDSGFNPNKLFTIHKGHDASWYTATSKEALKKEFSIPKEHLVFGYVANMRDNKGVDVFLKASAYLPPEFPVTFLFIGRPEEDEINKLTTSHPEISSRCRFAGFRKDSTALIGACDIAAQLSKWREGLPKTAIEAMIQGVPLIATPVGGTKELVIHEETGIFVPPENPEEVASAVIRLANDSALRELMGEASRVRMTTFLRIEDTVKKFDEMVRHLMTI